MLFSAGLDVRSVTRTGFVAFARSLKLTVCCNLLFPRYFLTIFVVDLDTVLNCKSTDA